MNKSITILILVFGSLIYNGKAYSQIVVSIDTSVRHQTVFGWGAGLRRSCNLLYASSPALISQVEDLCFKQLHVNILRSICEPTIEPAKPTKPFPLDSSKLVWTYYSNTKTNYALERAISVSNGRTNYIFSTNNSAPAWQKANHSITNGDTVLPTMYQYFVDYISYYMLAMKDKFHIRLNGISLFNEPGLSTYYESLTSSPVQVRNLVIKMRHRLDSMEAASMIPHTDLIAPESPVVSSTQNFPASVGNLALKNCIHYVDSVQGGIFVDTAAVRSVDILGTHNYFDETNTANWSKLKSVSKNKPIWITEVCTSTWDPYDNSSVNAVEQAKWIHRSFTIADARAFCMYSFYDTLPADTATINIGTLVIYRGDTIIIPKRYYGFKQFVNFVLPGYIRVNATSNNSHLYVSSYINPTKDTLVMVAINDSSIALPNVTFSCPVSNFPVAEYATCDKPNYSTTRLTDIPAPSSGQFSVIIPAMSIQTFIINLNSATGINEPGIRNYKLGIKIEPNPVSDNFTVDLPAGTVCDIIVYDNMGRKISENPKTTGKVSIDSSQLAPGLYYVQAISQYGIYTGKIVKY